MKCPEDNLIDKATDMFEFELGERGLRLIGNDLLSAQRAFRVTVRDLVREIANNFMAYPTGHFFLRKDAADMVERLCGLKDSVGR